MTEHRRPGRRGSVALVGAGPGDPGLLTLRGLALLRAATVVVHDRLVSPAILAFAREDAELIDVGKAPRAHRVTQSEINEVLVAKAAAGEQVVRLKGGDPFVFGRGGEEAEALARAGISVEVVPGITSAIAGPAVAGIPVTHRDAAASVVIATAHDAAGKAGSRIDWNAVAGADTAVLLMGVERLDDVVRALRAAGVPPLRPAAVIADASLPTQRTVTAPLARIAETARRAGIGPPAILVVGDVVGLRGVIGGWDARPLSGVRVLVSRAREQASELAAVLRELGAETVEAPAISIAAPRSWAPLDRAIARMRAGAYAWVVFTSANGVRMVQRRLEQAGLDARAFGSVRIAAVGPGTAGALAGLGLVADLVPPSFTTASVADVFPEGGGAVLLPRADIADPDLPEALRAKGWEPDAVVAYRITSRPRLDAAVRAQVHRREVDVVTFASGGTVRAFAAAFGDAMPESVKVVCIGPVTAQAANDAGMRVAAVARDHTIEGLVAAVLEVVRDETSPSRLRRAR